MFAWGESEGVCLLNIDTFKKYSDAPTGNNIAVSKNKRLFAIAKGVSNHVMLHDANSFRELKSDTSHTATIRAMSFSPSGRLLVTGGTDRFIRVLDVSTMSTKFVLSGHKSALRELAISPDERTLASTDLEHGIRLWDLRAGRELLDIGVDRVHMRWLQFTPDGSRLAGICDATHREYQWQGRNDQ